MHAGPSVLEVCDFYRVSQAKFALSLRKDFELKLLKNTGTVDIGTLGLHAIFSETFWAEGLRMLFEYEMSSTDLYVQCLVPH